MPTLPYRSGATVKITAAAGTIEANQPVIHGDLVGIALEPLASTATERSIIISVEGVWDKLNKDTAAITAGAKVYYTSAGKVTATSGSNKFLGFALDAAAAAAKTTGRVLVKP